MKKFIKMEENDDGTTTVSLSLDGVQTTQYVVGFLLIDSLLTEIELTEKDEVFAKKIEDASVFIPNNLEDLY